MLMAVRSIIAVLFNLTLYFIFGSLITGRLKGRRFSAILSVLTGFFLYYVVFELLCIPLTLRFSPLHLLSYIWAGVLLGAFIISSVINHKLWRQLFAETVDFMRKHSLFCIITGALIIIEAFIIIYCYQFTLDAAFYVGTANTALTTDSINRYNPYTGMWQDHFEMRYFFANYAICDAVMCFLTGLHPLVWTKTVMEAVVVILVNLLYYRIGRALFKDNLKKCALFMFFTVLLNFFYSTIFTAPDFFVTRTYEGKTVLAALVMPMIFLVYIKLLENHRDNFYWLLLALMSMGSLVMSNSASMLFPAALGIFMLSLLTVKRDFMIILKTALAALPCVISAFLYVLYVKGYYVIYTYPR